MSRRDTLNNIIKGIPYLPRELALVFANEYINNGGDAAGAKEVMRAHSSYDNYFGGNRRDDGSFVYSERKYHAKKLKYKDILRDYGLPANSPFFQEKFADLVAGEKSIQRFATDMATIYAGIVTQSDQIKKYYADNFGTGDLSIAAIFASALDISKSPLIYQNEINQAQIGGTALAHGFDMELGQVAKLASYGLEREAANNLFGMAQMQLPTLNELAQRHNDPDDEFTLDNFTDAIVIKDADDLRKMTRLVGAESSLFRSSATVRQNQSGALTGLFDE